MRQTTLLLITFTTLFTLTTVAEADEDDTSALIARFINRLGEWSREEEAKKQAEIRAEEAKKQAEIRAEELKKYSDEVLGKELAELNIPLYKEKASAWQMSMKSLNTAIFFGDLNEVKWLVWSGADVNKALEDHTPLHYASHFGQLYAAKLLIARGANIDPATDLGATPLHLACLKAHLDIAELLLRNGADKNNETNDSETPLDLVPRDMKEKFRQLFAKY